MAKPKVNKILMALVGIMVLALLLSFKKVSDAVEDVVNVPTDVIQYWARIILGGAVGLFLIYSGIVAMPVPILGASLMVVGVAVLGYSVWPLVGGGQTMDDG